MDIGAAAEARATESRSSTTEKFSIKVAEQQNRQIQPRALHGQLRFPKRLLLRVELQLRLDHVAVRHLAASFQILADRERVLRLIDGLLGSGVFALRDQQAVVSLGHGRRQSPARHFGFGARQGFARRRPDLCQCP